ncbi:MAG TPA: bifunctional transaldolase/phosoglucose isomerase [Candidatus Cybelea sp.]|jgi:transaldolase/glucose-6-phosphate isomerase|nr:bifunctional transaldolase/phosoglucose isomerase [Candidatus Cybelea sp.]
MKNQIQQLLDAGQSVWIDNLRRSMFASGELNRLIDSGLRGMTSNPTIFEKAIGAGNDYDEQLATLATSEKSADALFWDLAVQDIQSACDAFASVFASSGGNDGFVSLEVSPLLANDTAGTIAMVEELWNRVKRPNVMIKIPGTKEGLPAIEESIYRGYNINVTLVFSIEMYERAARAYIKGLERRMAEGKPIGKIRSVNSVFVSRIDTAVDKLLQERIAKGEKLDHLLGKTGIAGLKLTYQKFKEIFSSEEFAALKAKGAAVQRPLWASTSTKNPHYPDLMYVESVVGRDTINTMPPATIDALLDHGKIVPDTVETGLREAADVMRGLQDAKISLFDVTHQLQVDGVQLFSDSFAALLGAIVYKQKLLESNGAERVRLSLNASQPAYDAALERLASSDFLKRIWAHDATLWSNDPDAVAIIKKSLGWLDIQQHMLEEVPGMRSFANEAKDSFGFTVVCGMGGSSLAPDIIADTLGTYEGYPQLYVLDSTCPQQIKELEEKIHIPHTLFIISSKSGTTTEPNAFYAYFQNKVSKQVGSAAAGRNFAAITDPGTTLDKEAQEAGFRADFENDPNIGGRYSALSFVGIAPSAIAGYDVTLLLDRALGAMHANDRSVDPRTAPGVRFGAAIGGLAKEGRDKLTIIAHRSVKAFGAWAEQLIAESTGKLGTGIVPIEGEPLGEPKDYSNDRTFVYVGANLPDPEPGTDEKLQALEAAGHPVIRLAMNDRYDLGEQFYLWEIAVAAAGVILGINAFDQPNVQESKDNTVALLAQYARNGSFEEPKPDIQGPLFDVTYLSGSGMLRQAQHDKGRNPVQALAGLFAQLRPYDYNAITAYIARNLTHTALLDELRLKIRDAHRIATTVGFGPRFLHSTGQLHKGGPDTCVVLQITADDPDDPMIPGMNVGFRTLLAAQALGDWMSLDKRHRRGVRVHLKGEVEPALRALVAAVEEALTVRA